MRFPKAIDFISNEEISEDNQGAGPKPRKRLRLAWERKQLSNVKEALVRQHQSSMSAKQKRTAPLVRQAEDFSSKMPPEDCPSCADRHGEYEHFHLFKTELLLTFILVNNKV